MVDRDGFPAESSRRSYIALAQRYRHKAWEALAKARDARWVGREWAVPDLLHDALWSRRTANHFAALARRQLQSQPTRSRQQPVQLPLPLDETRRT
jgi:hypothetical protein